MSLNYNIYFSIKKQTNKKYDVETRRTVLAYIKSKLLFIKPRWIQVLVYGLLGDKM